MLSTPVFVAAVNRNLKIVNFFWLIGYEWRGSDERSLYSVTHVLDLESSILPVKTIDLLVESAAVQLMVKPSLFIETKSAWASTDGVPAVRLLITRVVERSVSESVSFRPIHIAALSVELVATPWTISGSFSYPLAVALSPPSNITAVGSKLSVLTDWFPVEVG